jgi:hypothetical protein
MVVVELGARLVTSILSKEGFFLVIGGLIASFVMLHSVDYNEFIFALNEYFVHTFDRILGSQ